MNPPQTQMYIGQRIHQVPWEVLQVGDEVGYSSVAKGRELTGVITRLHIV